VGEPFGSMVGAVVGVAVGVKVGVKLGVTVDLNSSGRANKITTKSRPSGFAGRRLLHTQLD
jgi:hypothetical protein